MDPLWTELEEKYPQIHTRCLDLELSTFNQIVSSDELIVSAECWKDVHPLLVTLPVRWNADYVLPYGLLYAKEPSRDVLQFIMSLDLPVLP